MSTAKKTVLSIILVAAVPSLGFSQTQLDPGTVPAPEAVSPALRLADLEQIALQQNPTLVQAGAQVRISQGKSLQAGLFPNPVIGYTAEQIGAEGTAGEFQGMFVEQQIITGGKLRLSREKFAQEAAQAQLQILAQRYRVLYSVRIAYYETLVRQQRLELQVRQLENTDEVNTTVRELINVGQANRADLLQAQIQSQRAEANLQMARRRYEGAWQELAAVVGVPEMPPTPLHGQIDFDSDRVVDRDAALANLLASSPQIRVAQAEVARDRIALRREQVEPIPNVNLRVEAGYNAEARDTVAGLEIGFRLPIYDRNQGTILQARAELSRAQAEVARLELMLRKRFAHAFAEYESAMLLANTYRNEALPRAEEVYQLYFQSFQERRAAWPQVLDAQREYFSLYDEYLDNVLAARLAEAGIDTMFLEDGLSQPPTPTPEGHRDATPRPR